MAARAVAGSAIIALVALQSCTTVLGMERATLDESTDGSTGNRPGNTAPMNSACPTPPTQACTDCLTANCGTAYANCIADSDCRVMLDEYAFCLGETCISASTEDCAGHLTPTLKDCLSVSKCASDCQATALASSCDLYCACLPSCDTAQWQMSPNPPILSTAQCLAGCALDSPRSGFVECKRDHCEYGKGDLMHCEHATGVNPVCEDRAPSVPTAGCLGLKESGWFCSAGSECCTKECIDGACK